MNNWIWAIICLQFFASGYYYHSRTMWKEEYFQTIIITILIATIGIASIPVVLIIGLSGFVYNKIIIGLHLNFLTKHVLLKKQIEGFTPEKYNDLHTRALGLSKNIRWWKFGDRIFIWIDKWTALNYLNKTTPNKP
jgi:hypothetical protein